MYKCPQAENEQKESKVYLVKCIWNSRSQLDFESVNEKLVYFAKDGTLIVAVCVVFGIKRTGEKIKKKKNNNFNSTGEAITAES